MLRLRSLALATLLTLVTVVISTTCSFAVTEKVIYNFTGGSDGERPIGNLVFDSSGNAYGTTTYGGDTECNSNVGCGTVFELSPNPDGTWMETTVYSFKGGKDGQFPYWGVVMDSAGDLYGTTSEGGGCSNEGCGTVFELKSAHDGTWSESIIHSFQGNADGSNPSGALAIGSNGTLYGVTPGGGARQDGAVFALRPDGNGWLKSTIYNFTGGYDGTSPQSVILRGSALYGTTMQGGAYGLGTVFKITQSDSQVVETTLYNFTGGLIGSEPTGSLAAQDGNLYGALAIGGAYNVGTIYELTPAQGNWSIHVLHTFTGGNDGGYPETGVILDQAGDVLGTTSRGGFYQLGTVFRLRRQENGRWGESVVWDFTGGDDGEYPESLVGSEGSLYGAMSAAPAGGIFELTR